MDPAPTSDLRPIGVRFAPTHVHIPLNDGREIGMPLNNRYLRWLREAAPGQRERWSITPAGDVYWPELDDGLEAEHLLRPQSLSA
jgi:hypothetical protein